MSDFITKVNGLPKAFQTHNETGIKAPHVDFAWVARIDTSIDAYKTNCTDYFVLGLANVTPECTIQYLNSSDVPWHNPNGNPEAWDHAIELPESLVPTDVAAGGRFLYGYDLNYVRSSHDPDIQKFTRICSGDTIHIRLVQKNKKNLASPHVDIVLPSDTDLPKIKLHLYTPNRQSEGPKNGWEHVPCVQARNLSNFVMRAPSDTKPPVMGSSHLINWKVTQDTLTLSGDPCAASPKNKVIFRQGPGPGDIISSNPVNPDGSFSVGVRLHEVAKKTLWLEVVDEAENSLPLGEIFIPNPLEIDTPEE